MKLLIVEDDPLLAHNLAKLLRPQYRVDLAYKGNSALIKAETNFYSLLIIDLNLPDLSGFELIRELRSDGIQTPILIVSGYQGKQDIAQALGAGADDYLTKPYSEIELKARVKALLRRQKKPLTEKEVRLGGLKFNTWNKTVNIKGQPIRLSKTEGLIFECLIRNLDRIVTCDILIETVWNNPFTKKNTLEAHITNLRQKIDKQFKLPVIETVYGEGYIIRRRQY